MTDTATPEHDNNGMAGTAVERSNLYGFLATVFRKEPSLEFLHNIRQVALLEALEDVGVDLRGDFLDRDDEDLAEELAIEYTRLGPGKHIPPYEAAQREGALRARSRATSSPLSVPVASNAPRTTTVCQITLPSSLNSCRRSPTAKPTRGAPARSPKRGA